ncbi:MAG: putative NADH:ubiquinone oxidoreductase-subunit RnfB [Pseudomonadota bacterium]|jgi:electron transport complex protein RnfB
MKSSKLSSLTSDLKILSEQIDALLPQMHCGQCSYAGCFPYAQAIAATTAEINRCPPGGAKTLKALANLLEKDAEPFIAEIRQQEKSAMTAFIRESECIGCTKCIQACPVDAILGAAKQLHTVLTKECTGCGLCLAPCPVDCIDMLVLDQPNYQAQRARQRFHARNKRLEKKPTIEAVATKPVQQTSEQLVYIQAAIVRAKTKKTNLTFQKITDS